MSLGERLREARQTRGLSLEGVAAKLGTSYQTIWRYEHDERNPPGASLYGLAAFYGRTVEWLLGEEATMAVPEPEDTNGNGTTHVAPKLIPIVGRILSTGQVADWQEHVGTVEVPTFVTAEAPRCFALQVDGDAPSRHGIREGDTAVVDPDSEFIDGRMYIVQNHFRDRRGTLSVIRFNALVFVGDVLVVAGLFGFHQSTPHLFRSDESWRDLLSLSSGSRIWHRACRSTWSARAGLSPHRCNAPDYPRNICLTSHATPTGLAVDKLCDVLFQCQASPDTLARRPDQRYGDQQVPLWCFDGLERAGGRKFFPVLLGLNRVVPEHVLGIQKGLIYRVAHRANAGDVWKDYAIGSLGAVYQCWISNHGIPPILSSPPSLR
jgi:transcriptional regulator with XRE-family HTH domain